MVKKKKNKVSPMMKLLIIMLIFPVAIIMYILYAVVTSVFQEQPSQGLLAGELEVPTSYIPIYMEAAEKYNVPWTLIAAHHRIETRFSTMSTLVSPVGAEGHLQFMPCTFVGWQHPSCKDLGLGDISQQDKMNPAIIKKYGGYGVDGNGDGIADPFNITDAIYSAANFLANSGAAEGEIKKAIFQYNHSNDYVNDVYYFYELYSSIQGKLEATANM